MFVHDWIKKIPFFKKYLYDLNFDRGRIKKAKKTYKIAKQNIIGSIAIKLAILALIGFGFSGMWLGVFADVGVSLLAVLNSLRAMLK